MMSICSEPFIGLLELPIQPKAPSSCLWSSYQNGPCTAWVRDHGVPVKSRPEAHCSSLQVFSTGWAHIGVSTAKNERQEPPGVIVEGSIIVGA